MPRKTLVFGERVSKHVRVSVIVRLELSLLLFLLLLLGLRPG